MASRRCHVAVCGCENPVFRKSPLRDQQPGRGRWLPFPKRLRHFSCFGNADVAVRRSGSNRLDPFVFDEKRRGRRRTKLGSISRRKRRETRKETRQEGAGGAWQTAASLPSVAFGRRSGGSGGGGGGNGGGERAVKTTMVFSAINDAIVVVVVVASII